MSTASASQQTGLTSAPQKAAVHVRNFTRRHVPLFRRLTPPSPLTLNPPQSPQAQASTAPHGGGPQDLMREAERMALAPFGYGGGGPLSALERQGGPLSLLSGSSGLSPFGGLLRGVAPPMSCDVFETDAGMQYAINMPVRLAFCPPPALYKCALTPLPSPPLTPLHTPHPNPTPHPGRLQGGHPA